MTYTLIRTRLQVWDQILDEPAKGTVIVTPSSAPIKDVTGNRLLISPNVVHLDADGWYEADLAPSDDPGLTPTGFGYTFDIRAKGFTYQFTTQVRLADATLVTEVNPETLEEFTHYELDLTGLAPVLPDIPTSEAQALRDEMIVLRDDANDATLAAEQAAASVNRGAPNGTAPLGADSKVPNANLPAFAAPTSLSGFRVTAAVADANATIPTNNYTVIQAALDAAGAAVTSSALGQVRVILPHASQPYGIDNTLSVPAGVEFVGEGAATLKLNVTRARIIDLSNRVGAKVRGIRFELSDKLTSAAVRVGIGSVNSEITGCTFTGLSVAWPVRVEGGAVSTLIAGNTFQSVTHGVSVYADNTLTRVLDNVFKDWGEVAISLLGTATLATSDCTINGNQISDTTQAADTRQPIAIQGAGAYHARVMVEHNRVKGNGLPHHQTLDAGDPENGTQLGGTADCISMHWCVDSVIADNMVSDSGEVGITVSQSSKRVRVRDNTITDSNGDGIACGANGTTVTDIWITGNGITNSGKELGAATPRTGAQAAIWIKNLTGGEVSGNTCTDDQATPTQLAAIYHSDCIDVEIGHNPRRGGTALLFLEASSGSTFRFNLPAERVKQQADQSATSTTPASLDDLGLVLEKGGVYEFQAWIIYSTNQVTTEDLTLKWSVTTGTSVEWTGGGAAGATTGPAANTTSWNIAFLTTTASAVCGGATGVSNLVAQPSGTIEVGDGGLTELQFAQTNGTADPVTVFAGSWIRFNRIG